MNKAILLFLLVFAATAWPSLTQASTIEHVNIGRIAVNDQSVSSQQNAGKRALAQVFIKISGDTDVLKAPEIKKAVDNYEQFLISSSFLQQEQELIFEATFNQSKIEQLLMASQLSVWTNLRPAALIWLAKEDSQGEKVLVSQNRMQESNLRQRLKLQAYARGVEIILPIGDLDDAMKLPVYDIWNQFMSRILEQSMRYKTDYVISATMQSFTQEDQAILNALNQSQFEQMQAELNGQSLDTDALGTDPLDNDVLNSEVSINAADNINKDNAVTDIIVNDLLAQSQTIEQLNQRADANDVANDVMPEELSEDGFLLEELAQQMANFEPIILPEGTTHKMDYAITNRSQVHTGRLYGNSEGDLVKKIVDQYANILAKEFALGNQANEPNGGQISGLQLVLENVRDLADYVEAIALIESIPSVSSATLVKQANNRAYINVQQSIGQSRLQAILSLDKRMQLDFSQAQDNQLFFIWQGE